MKPPAAAPQPASVAEYIAACPPEVRPVLEQLRATVRAAEPEAEEFISYRMPAYRLRGVLLYFAAFQQHIGVYPPVSGDPDLQRALAPYAGPKGNLRFPLSQPLPYDLITRIVTHRAAQDRAKSPPKARRRAQPTAARPQKAPSAT